MPTRVIREGFLDSETILRAGEPAECLYHRLLLVADDYGRLDGRPAMILNKAYPAGAPDGVDVHEIARRLETLKALELAIAYETAGKPYLALPRFRQRTRALKSRFPEPPPSIQLRLAQLETAPAQPAKPAPRKSENPPDPQPATDPKKPPRNPRNDGQMTGKRRTNGGQVSGVRPLESEAETEAFNKHHGIVNRGGSTGLSTGQSTEPPKGPAPGKLDQLAQTFGLDRMQGETDQQLQLRIRQMQVLRQAGGL